MITVQPAYGRDYKSAKQALADWAKGNDFRINQLSHPDNGRYISIRDNQAVEIRFNNHRNVTVWSPENGNAHT